ncbi:MAG: hypothetical protein WBO00_09715, partial [Steroidobacteraceae bacterium]
MNTCIRTLLRSSLSLAVLLTASGAVAAGEIDFVFDPANFTPGAAIDNQYLPIIAGSVFVYNSESGDGCAVNEIRVTGNTKDDFAAPYESILAWEVEDREWLDSECAGNYSLVESTKDWFAQDH